MRLVGARSGLFAAILVIVVLAAAFVVACPDGIHLAMAQDRDGACAVMTHASVLATAAETGGGTSLLLVALAVAFALTVAPGAERLEVVTGRIGSLPGRPFDPLNGRFRI